jgi:hypothetical protein
VVNAGGELGATALGRAMELSCIICSVARILPDAYVLLSIPLSHELPCMSPGIPEIPTVCGCSYEFP